MKKGFSAGIYLKKEQEAFLSHPLNAINAIDAKVWNIKEIEIKLGQ